MRSARVTYLRDMGHDVQPELDEIVRHLADGETPARATPDAELAAKVWHAVPRRGVPVVEVRALWDRITKTVTEETVPVAPVSRKRGTPNRNTQQSTRPRRWIPIAAAACAVIVAGVGVAASHTGISLFPKRAATVATEYVTKRGERADIELNDGTRIRLNVDSRITVIASGSQGERVVELDGEAQFTVTHDETRPFVVKANGTVVRDLATVFNVKAYPHSGTTRIAVLDGRVSVQSPVTDATNAIVLDAMEFAAVNASGTAESGRVANMRAEFDWVNGMLVLDRVELGDALAQLARWYGVEFRVSDPEMLHVRVNLTLPERMTRETLRDIADVLEVQVEREENTVMFSPRTK